MDLGSPNPPTDMGTESDINVDLRVIIPITIICLIIGE
jgi:hypothetical protein